MTTPRFSVVTSTYNQLELLKRVKDGLDNQTFKDFEWIIADDGSSDGTAEWCKENNITHIYQEDDGYRLVEILNRAGMYVSGEHIVWIMADSKPRPTFLEKLNEVVSPSRMVTGLRMNVDKDEKLIGPDWRIHNVIPTGGNAIHIKHPRPYVSMTLNTMSMPTTMWAEMGGIHPGYKGYGKMDWWMAAWAHYHGYELWWASEAVVDHIQHDNREDTKENTELFNKHIEEFENESSN